MKISRINIAVKAALIIGLPFMLIACQSPSASSNTATPPPGSVTATTNEVTPEIQSITLSNTTSSAASVAITPPQSTYFDFYTAQSNKPLWCTGNTCSTPCPSITFSLSSGQSCKVYIHANNTIAVGHVEHDHIQVSLNGSPDAFALTNTGVLYAAGDFTQIDSQPATYVASWNGNSWSSMPGLTSSGYALSIAPNGGLYIGTDASGVKEWTGNQWNPIGNPLSSTNGLVAALTFDNTGNLYAGGEFTTLSGVPANKIAQFNGNTWSAVTNPSASTHGVTGPEVTSLQYYNGKLYLGGYFAAIDGQPTHSIAIWNPQTQTWSPIASGFDSGVNAMAFDQHGTLYIGGDFDNAQGQYVGHIAQFNGQTFTGVTNPNSHDHGLNVQSYSLAFDNQNTLYSGGNFTQSDDSPTNYISSWNGTNWDAVTSPSAIAHGMSGVSEPSVEALAYDKNAQIMYAGGSFTTVDNLPMQNLASWNGSSWSPVTNTSSATHGFNSYVYALALGNQLSIQESNS